MDNKQQFKLIITAHKIYREVRISQGCQVFTVGTSSIADVRLRESSFEEPFMFCMKRTGDEWNIECESNVCIIDSDKRRTQTGPVFPNIERKVLYKGNGREILTMCLLANIEKQKQFDRRISIQETGNFRIGGTAECQIQLLKGCGKRTQIFLSQQQSVCYVSVELSQNNNVLLNGNSVQSVHRLQDMDFITIGTYEYCYNKGFLYTDSTDFVHISGVSYRDIPEGLDHNEYPKFNRCARIRIVADEEKIKILDPPAVIQEPRGNIVMQLFPAVAMLGVTVVLRSIISTSGMTMMIMSAGTMGVGILTSIMNIVSERKEYKKKVQNRIDVYQRYIEDKKKEIEEKRAEEVNYLEHQYYSVEKDLQMVKEFRKELFERTPEDKDFLEIYLGIGEKKSMKQIDFKEQERVELPDSLMQLPGEVAAEYENIQKVPITLDLKKKGMTGIVGKRFQLYNMLKIMTLDLSVRHSYDDVKMLYCIAEEDKDKFSWVRFLPHIQNRTLNRRNIICDTESRNAMYEYLYKELSVRGKERKTPALIVFVYQDEEIQRHPLFQLVDTADEKGIHFIFFSEFEEQIPAGCTQIVKLDDGYSGIKIDAEDGMNTEQFSIYSIADKEIGTAIHKMAPIYCEEVSLESSLTKSITFFEMLNIGSPEEINLGERWTTAQIDRTMAAPLGVNAKNELVYLDLNEKAHGPHGLVAGTTGSGKSEILQSYILSMALSYHPYEVSFVIIDFKGGGMVNQFKNLPHLIGSITNIDGREIERSLQSIRAELKKRQELFAQYDVNHIDAYIRLSRQGKTEVPLPHLIIIVDEFAELKREQPDFMKELVSAARIGRSLGVHLILATQKPSGVVDPQIWSNSRFKLCLKVQTQADSNEVLKTPLAAEIREPGRAYLQVGNNEIFELFQSAYSGAPAGGHVSGKTNSFQISRVSLSGKRTVVYKQSPQKSEQGSENQLTSVVNYIADFCEKSHLKQLPYICLPTLAEKIALRDLKENTDRTTGLTLPLGTYDDPGRQYQGEFYLNVTTENTMIIGSSQFGKTNLLQVIVKGLAEQYRPEELQMYILDFGSMIFRNFEDLHHVGGVICASEDEKLKNFFKLLNQEMKTRKEQLAKAGVGSYASYLEAGLQGMPQIVVLVDNLTVMKELYLMENDSLLPLCRDGLAVGISFVIANNQTAGIGYKYLSNFGNRIALYCNDNTEYHTLLGGFRMQPQGIPGRCLMEKEKTIHEAQTYLAFDGEKEIDRINQIQAFVQKRNAECPDSYAVPIPVVPDVVTGKILKEQFHVQGNNLQAVLGVDYASISAATLSFASQEVLGITGREEFGKSAFVKLLFHQLSHIGAEIYVMDDAMGNLEYTREDLQTELYSRDVSNLGEMLEELHEKMEERYQKVAEAGMSAIEDAMPYVFLIQNNDVPAKIQEDKELLSKYKELFSKYKGMKLLILYSNLENAQISFSAPEPLKMLKEKKQFLVFEDVSGVKISDLNFTQQNSFKKPLEEGEAYLIQGGQIRKLKLVRGIEKDERC